MTIAGWKTVIDDAAALGVGMVQFIGGEPSLHPDLPALTEHAVSRGVEVEVFTNLVHVTGTLWDVFTQPGVRLATSYYSTDPEEHARVTRRPSHARTRANIAEAVRRGIPVRAGVIDVLDGQHVGDAKEELADLGVSDVTVDRLRGVGRGVRALEADPSQLCGRCADGNVAISPDGMVWPCVFARWLPIGNVQEAALADVVASPGMVEVSARLREHFSSPEMPCVPRMCNPQCGPSCSPACRPKGDCRPAGGCVPKY